MKESKWTVVPIERYFTKSGCVRYRCKLPYCLNILGD